MFCEIFSQHPGGFSFLAYAFLHAIHVCACQLSTRLELNLTQSINGASFKAVALLNFKSLKMYLVLFGLNQAGMIL